MSNKAPNRISTHPPVPAITTYTDQPERGIDQAADPHAASPKAEQPAAKAAGKAPKKPTNEKE